jgi:cytochrome c-type biogenesis protein CcmE
MSKGAQLALGAITVFGLLAWFGFSNLESASTFQYYQNLDEFLVEASTTSELEGRSLRVHGYVANGSIERDLPAKQVHFRVQQDPPHKSGEGTNLLAVTYHGLETPDLFRDGAEVVVEGTVEGTVRGGSAGREKQVTFHADNLLAKCPSKFEANKEGVEPETAGM